MSVNSRLIRLFQTAPRIPYHQGSRFVLMSDCHRGIGNWSDNFLKNQHLFLAALTYYYQRDFTYIELGDGDELWENRSMKQIIQIHADTFEMMAKFYRENRLYMIYGNHDRVKEKQKFLSLNCREYYCENKCCSSPLLPGLCVHEGIILKNISTETQLFLLHGHQGDLLNDTLWKFSRFLVRYVWRPLELLAFHDPTSAAKNNTKKGAVEKRLSAWSSLHQQVLIAGHTHRPMFPSDGSSLYFNCGSCVHPLGITALEIIGDELSLVKWDVKTKSDRSLYVERTVLNGPLNPFRFLESGNGKILPY